MKVLLINGSPLQQGSTAEALHIIADTLTEEGVAHQTLWLGNHPVQDCIACHACRDGKERCVFDDEANRIIKTMAECDGLIVGCPVYFAHPTGRILSILDRAFYAASAPFHHKPAAAVTVARRAGTTATVDVLNKYFTIAQMPVVSSQYWNMVHGNSPAEVRSDAEGAQIMRTLARNMAWLLRCIEAGKAAGVALPCPEPRVATNFIGNGTLPNPSGI